MILIIVLVQQRKNLVLTVRLNLHYNGKESCLYVDNTDLQI